MKRIGAWAMVLVGLLAICHGFLAWSAARGKCATFDETLHMTGAYAARFMGDYRINSEDPMLFQRWAGLGIKQGELKIDTADPQWTQGIDKMLSHWDLCSRALYGTVPGEGGGIGQTALNRARGWMALVSAAVCALVGWWGWNAGGRGKRGLIAAVIAAGLYALDPNFLGHGSLVKNDVMITLCFLLAMVGLGRCMKGVTAGGLALVMAGVAAGLVVKFSGVLLAITVVGGLGLRALMRREWEVFGRRLSTRWGRLAAAGGIAVLMGAVGWGGIWASYGFRYSVAPDSNTHFSLDWEKGYERWIRQMKAEQSDAALPGPSQTINQMTVANDGGQPGAVVGAAGWAMRRHFLPETWVKGFTYTYLSTQIRDSYLMGEMTKMGFASYFFWAALFKTPLGLIFGVVAGAVVWWRLPKVGAGGRAGGDETWIVWAVGLIAGVYVFMAVRGSLNLGIRHMLPLYPAAMVLVGVMLARAWELRPTVGKWLAAVAVGGVMVESLASFPDELAFFNVPSQLAGPVNLLADSNLDWGQDLPLLADWQKAHPDRVLWLAYFGTARPEAFGIRFFPLPGTGFTSIQNPHPIGHGSRMSGVWAISTSFLCGLYNPMGGDEGPHLYMRMMLERRPIARLGGGWGKGGSMWLFDLDERGGGK